MKFNGSQIIATQFIAFHDQIHDNINEIKNVLSKNDDKLARETFYNTFSSLSKEMKLKTLSKELIDKGVLYIPSMYENEIIERFKGVYGLKKGKDEAIKFLMNHDYYLKQLHDLYLRLRLIIDSKDIIYYDELIKSKLLDLASLDSAKPLNLVQLISAIKNDLLITPTSLSFHDMLAFYKRNLPSNRIKTISSSNSSSFQKIPWKSTHKIRHYGQFRNIDVKDELIEHQKDSFNRYQNIKNYGLKTVGAKDSLIIDYFFPGKFIYLLAIKINTRKAYAIPSDLITETTKGSWIVPKKGNRTNESTIKALNKLKSLTNINVITCDQEGAFNSSLVREWCHKNNIIIHLYNKNDMKGIIETSAASDKSRANHSTLALIDRLSKTLRQMSMLAYGTQSINPHMMESLINEYNNSPHSTLSKVLKRNITPEQMELSQKLRDEFVRLIHRENVIKTLSSQFEGLKGDAPDFEVKGKVYIMNEASLFDKLKPKLLPGAWDVVGRKGFNYVCRNENGKELIVPRWMLKTRL